MTKTIHLTLMMTSTQVVETSVTTTENNPSQDYIHLHDQTILLHFMYYFQYSAYITYNTITYAINNITVQ